MHIVSAIHPHFEPRPIEIQRPAKTVHHRSQGIFKHTLNSARGTQVIDENDFTSGSNNTRKFVQGRFWVRHSCYNVLSYDSVERRSVKTEMLRVHYRKRLDMSKIVSTHTFMCFSKHRFRIVYPEHADGAWIVNQGDARPDADIQNSSSNPLGDGYCGLAAGLE